MIRHLASYPNLLVSYNGISTKALSPNVYPELRKSTPSDDDEIKSEGTYGDEASSSGENDTASIEDNTSSIEDDTSSIKDDTASIEDNRASIEDYTSTDQDYASSDEDYTFSDENYVSSSHKKVKKSISNKEIIKVKTQTKRTRALRNVDPDRLVLPKITLKLTDILSLKEFSELRDDFHQHLIEMTWKDGGARSKGFTRNQASEITNLFFGELMAHAGMSNVARLVRDYNQCYQDKPGRAFVVMTQSILYKTDNLPNLREFFSIAEQPGMRMEAHAWLRNFYQNVARTRLMENYKTRMNGLNQDDKEFIRYVKRYRKGRGRATCLNNYLGNVLQFNLGNAFHELIEEAKGIHYLVSVFGHGILCLLPEHGAASLIRFDIQKMKEGRVFETLRGLVPELKSISEFLEKNLFGPIMNGQKLEFGDQGFGQGRSMLTKFQNSVKSSGELRSRKRRTVTRRACRS